MKEIKTFWFTNVSGVIGIVVGEDEVTKKRKAYIGVASGAGVQADTDYIKSFGSPVSLAVLREMAALMVKPSEGPEMNLEREKGE